MLQQEGPDALRRDSSGQRREGKRSRQRELKESICCLPQEARGWPTNLWYPSHLKIPPGGYGYKGVGVSSRVVVECGGAH